MFKTLIYNGIEYENFEINIKGQIKNKSTGTIHKPYICDQGYYVVPLSMGQRGKVKVIRVHKAIAENFLPNPNSNLYNVIHHKDGNKLNNNINNLEWTTNRINTQYYYKELYAQNEYGNNRKLSKDDVRYIREHHNIISLNEMAKMFNISKTAILDVVKMRSYKEVI